MELALNWIVVEEEPSVSDEPPLSCALSTSNDRPSIPHTRSEQAQARARSEARKSGRVLSREAGAECVLDDAFSR